MSETTYAVHTATCTYLLDEDGICRWTHAPIGVAPPGAERCVGAQFVACLDVRSEGGLVGELCLGAAALFVRQEEGRFVLLRTLPIESVEIRDGIPVAEPPRPAPAPPAPITMGETPRPPPQAIEDPHSFAETPIFVRDSLDMEEIPEAPLPLPSWSLETGSYESAAALADPRLAPPAATMELPRFEGTPSMAGIDAPLPVPALSWNPDETAPLDPRWSSPGEVLDLEELLSISVTEVTLKLPLYRSTLAAHAELPSATPRREAPPGGLPRSAIVNPGRRLR